MEAEIKELKQTLIRLQQDAQAYKKANEVLTDRLNEYEARLREHGEVLRMIPAMQKQIAYLKGRIDKQKQKTEEKPIISL
jgi:predicted RNase H-like nuclease (RuvC/YqgF family)